MSDKDLLDVDIIEADLKTKLVGSKVVLFRSTASTNNVAWQYAANKANSGLAVFAESQSAGRGRFGNKWLSDQGKSILLSVLLKDLPCPAELITVAAAVATAEAITKTTQPNPIEATIKWPNDIMINAKKVAGILLESRKTVNSTDCVIGIGINCHQSEDFFDSTELKMPATSIDLETSNNIDRNLLAANLLTSLDKWIAAAQSDPKKILNEWQKLSSQLGHHITVESDNQHFSGNCIGIDPAKGLILQLDTGPIRIFNASQTTVVKHQ